MAEKRKADELAKDPNATAGKIRTQRQQKEDRLREIMQNGTTPDRSKPVK